MLRQRQSSHATNWKASKPASSNTMTVSHCILPSSNNPIHSILWRAATARSNCRFSSVLDETTVHSRANPKLQRHQRVFFEDRIDLFNFITSTKSRFWLKFWKYSVSRADPKMFALKKVLCRFCESPTKLFPKVGLRPSPSYWASFNIPMENINSE